MTERPDSATITFKVNLPPEVISTYFEGVAQVEKAKRSLPDLGLPSWSDLVSYIPSVVETISSITADLGKKCDACEKRCQQEPKVVQCRECEPCCKSVLPPPSVVFSASSESEPAADDHEEPDTADKHKPAYDEDSEVPLNTTATGQMPDMGNIMEAMGPMMQQLSSVFGGVAPQAPKGHKQSSPKKPVSKKGSTRVAAKAKIAKEVAKDASKSDALNARLEALISQEDSKDGVPHE